MRRLWVLLVALPALFPCASAIAGTYEDPVNGYSIQVPSGWREIPIAAEERYIVGRWQSEREYQDPKEWSSHRPELRVILFEPAGKKVEVKKTDTGVEARLTNPYKTFQDWVKSDQDGGRFISKEEPATVGGLSATRYEVAYQKLTVPRHGIAFVFRTPDVDICLTTEVLETQWDKLSPSILQCMKSFKVIPKTAKALDKPEDAHPVILDLEKKTPVERLKIRTDAFEKRVAIATERLPDGWVVKRSKNYVVLSHADPRFTDLILDQADAIRSWAEAKLPFMGDGLPGPELLRICKDYDEERAFRDISSRSGGWVHEITLSRSEGFWGVGNTASQVFDSWLRDKNPRLSASMPPWLERGIDEWIDHAYMHAGKLEFRPDGPLIAGLKLAAKAKKLIPPKEMLQMSYNDLDQWGKDDKAPDPSGPGGPGGFPTGAEWINYRISGFQQAAGFVRYLLEGPGKSNPRTKDLLKTYVLALDEYLRAQAERDVQVTATESQPALTEEEEEARFKNRKSYWKDHEKDLIKAVFEKAFASWTDADWLAIEKSYKAYAL